jgi:hypothetical protein
MDEGTAVDLAAAHEAGEIAGDPEDGFFYCTVPEVPEPELDPNMAPPRFELIQLFRKKWVNGTVLRYYFFNEETDGEWVQFSNGTREWRSWVGPEAQREVVRRAFQVWKNVGIGLEFKEVGSRDEAEIRIGFMRGDGSWSYVGRDLVDLNLSVNERTMNFGWDLARRASEIDTAIHEIGHTLGFPHEHQNPKAGIVWDEDAVYAALAKPPNSWDRQKTFYNVIRKIAPDTVQGSNWDPDSVMHYPFPAGFIKEPADYRSGVQPAGGLSERDKTWVLTFYPALEPQYPSLAPFQPAFLSIEPGDQKNFAIRPEATRTYTMQTFGTADTVMVLFEEVGGELRYLTGDDDSGTSSNARIKWKLFQSRNYVLRVRLYYSGGAGKTAVMIW